MKTIQLINKHRDKHVIFDDDIFEQAVIYRWGGLSPRGSRTTYARASINGASIYAHHFVIGKPQNGLVTDHINGNALDNRRENLRHITQGANIQAAHDLMAFGGRNERKHGGVRQVVRTLANGKTRIYFYDQDTRKRIPEAEALARFGNDIPPSLMAALERINNEQT